MEPKLIKGDSHTDNRGKVTFNNSFVCESIKRIYFIENQTIDFIRGWQGHKIEQRWFTVTKGSFKISLIKIDNWDSPSLSLVPIEFILEDENMDVLHVPFGYISKIKALEDNSKLMALSDFALGEIQDEYRFPLELFNQE